MFEHSKPIWIQGADGEMNGLYAFVFPFTAGREEISVHIAACDVYQAYCNGEFIATGPARCGDGYYRADCLFLKNHVREGENFLTVFVAGYNVNCFEYLCAEPFLQLEALAGGKFLFGTGGDTAAYAVSEHEQRTARYSFQRTFTEVWHLNDSYARLRGGRGKRQVQTIEVGTKKILPRLSAYPKFSRADGVVIGCGKMSLREEDFNARKLNGVPFLEPRDEYRAYPQSELTANVYRELCSMRTLEKGKVSGGNTLRGGEFRLFDFSVDRCGLIGLDVAAEEDGILYILFDEILTDGDIDALRMDCLNCIKLHISAGERKFLSLEAYTFRYAKIFCFSGNVEIRRFYTADVSCPLADEVKFTCENKKLEKIFAAALNSFRFNAVDIFMDCPSRERAGWLCDSYFTGRVERYLFGKSRIEHDFLENFLLNERERYIPDKMLPMCYPSLHPDGGFIPTWAMWFVLELNAYTQTNGEALKAKAEKKIDRLLEYFAGFENEWGLLEDLPGWVFIEWSKAADFSNGVNYCVNMLYSLVLRTAGEMYGKRELISKGERIAALVREHSFDGKFFTDHAVRENGKIVFCGERTEVCQYYAFFTGVATPQTYPELFRILTEEFGPDRKNNNPYPDIWFANAFIGNYLRMMILEKYKMYAQLLDEIEGYFLYMADKTMTLWENDTDFASCNHGFASYILVCIARSLTGYCGADAEGNIIFRQDHQSNIGCELSVLAGDSAVRIAVKDGKREFYVEQGRAQL